MHKTNWWQYLFSPLLFFVIFKFKIIGDESFSSLILFTWLFSITIDDKIDDWWQQNMSKIVIKYCHKIVTIGDESFSSPILFTLLFLSNYLWQKICYNGDEIFCHKLVTIGDKLLFSHMLFTWSFFNNYLWRNS